ncbi:MAG: UDP-N-acetylmuramoyl-L-alanine--D-glutamate ligase [Bacteroidia bacterium]|nr:UDP-N-acetylmuramoyl-L-alanine--D-glutamate ligase [Bacteroidia bacterium]
MAKTAILGGGESGVGAAILAKKQGQEVWLSDAGLIKENYKNELIQNAIPFEEGTHSIDKFFDADLIVKSPGIPGTVPIIQQLKAAGKAVISEIEYASRYTTARIIGITGSNGKTTTTSLIYHLLKAAGKDVGLGGNIGQSFALQVAMEKREGYVLEISSFQLDDIETFRPDVAVLLNITPDHLDRYSYSLDNYAAAKFRITENQTMQNAFIWCLEDEQSLRMMEKLSVLAKKQGFGLKKTPDSAAWMENNWLHLAASGPVMDFREMNLLGRHNQVNTLAALLAVEAYGVDVKSLTPALKSFLPIEHRLEPCGEIKGVRYINDSKATNVDAVYFALEGLEGPIVWMAGGVDKGNDYQPLVSFVQEKVKAIVVLGEKKEKFLKAFNVPVYQEMSMKSAVETAGKLSQPGDTVLLSPACASFDLFTNYEDRGKQFKAAVQEIINKQ